jgi:histone-lysine N-methyltransferase SETMAR
MCRIAGLFFLQRLKESMSRDACDFLNIKTQAVSKFFFLQGKALKKIHTILEEILGEHAPSYATVKNWVAQIKRGHFSICDAPCPGWPKTVTTPEIIDHIHEPIFEDCRISAKSIYEQMVISREGVGSIFHEDLDMRKLSAKWIPKYLNADEKCQWRQSYEKLFKFFLPDRNAFLSRFVTMDKTWLYHYDPESKQQSIEWRHSGSPRTKKFRVQKSTGKVLTLIFWDQDSILLNDYLPKRQTINAEYYSFLLVQFKDILKGKVPPEGHQAGFVLARQCTGLPGTCNPEESGLPRVPCLNHPPYSLDLSPSY